MAIIAIAASMTTMEAMNKMTMITTMSSMINDDHGKRNNLDGNVKNDRND